MNMMFVTSMKYMKLAVYVYPHISYKYHSIGCSFLHRTIMISGYNSKDG